MNEEDNFRSNDKLSIELKPKMNRFLATYIFFSFPGFLVSIFWILVLGIFLVGVVFGNGGEAQMEETLTYKTVRENPNTDNAILIYELNGPIEVGDSATSGYLRTEGIYTELVKRDFEEIKNNPDIKNVVFKMNTPGGLVFASEVLGDEIKDLVENKNQKEAVFYFDQIVASGGLWAAYKNENYVVGSPYGQSGSVGVIVSLPNYKELADNIGYKEVVIKSSDAKDLGNPFKEVQESELEYLQEEVDRTFERFVNVVSDGRDLEKSEVTEFANGLIFNNEKAKNYGLIDELGDIDIAIERAGQNVGLENYDVIKIESEPPIFGSLFARSSILEVLGLPVGVTKAIEKETVLESGRFYAIDETLI
jgi:protease-4